MQSGREKQQGQSADTAETRTWADIEQIARRVIYAANLAVMSHAELDPFTDRNPSESRTEKKAG
jgi:hypothetical protein